MRIFKIVRGTKRVTDDKENDNEILETVVIQFTLITVGI